MSHVKTEYLTILHISDFHFKPNIQYDQDTILSGLLEKIKEMNETEWRPDLILCTGDIAYSGKPKEYEAAQKFLDQLLKITGLTKRKLMAVPGNHDIDWDEPSPILDIELTTDEDVDNFFQSPNLLKKVFKKLHGYQKFSQKYLKQPFDENHYYFAKIVKIRGFRVGVAGLNSAWPYHKKLYKKSEAFDQLLGRIPLKKALEQIKEADLKIVMFHHPLQWLLELEQPNIRALLEEKADLVLNGHQFKSNIEIHHVGAERRLLYIQGGPAYGAKPWPNRVHLIRWEIQENNKTIKIYPLKFDPEINRWVLDTAIFPAKQGYIGHYDMTTKPEVSPTHKALIISVGTGTRASKSIIESLANALAYSINHHNPDKTFFIATKESRKTTLPLILKKIKPKPYEVIMIENPDNIQLIYETLQPKIKEIRENYDQLTVDYTSGTKAMTAAIAILATIYEATELSYITGKREGGIVQPGTERIVPIRPYFAIIEQKIKTAIQFFNRNQYGATMTILKQIQKTTKDPKITGRIESLLNLAKAYELWDKFQHKKAFKILKKIKIKQIDKNKQFLGQLINKIEKNQEPEPYLIADLINNAERRAKEELKYDDAVARLYRTIELIAQHRLKIKYGIDSSQVKLKQIPQKLLKKWNIPSEKEAIKLALERDYELLKAKGDELGEKYFEDEELRNLLSKRNTSILAHGLTPIAQKTYKKLHEKTIEYAKITIKNLDSLIEVAKFIKWKE